MEDTVKALEKKWAAVQENALKQPSPGIISYLCYVYICVSVYVKEKLNYYLSA
jgi:hypothetical protein